MTDLSFVSREIAMRGLIALVLLACGIVLLLAQFFLLPATSPGGDVRLGVIGLVLVVAAMVLDRNRMRRRHKD